MGWPIYVLAWVKCPNDGKFYYQEVYGGKSWLAALRAAIKAKRSGAGCVKLEWR